MMGIIRAWLISKRTHLLVWSIFIAWEVIVIGLAVGKFGSPLAYAIHYVVVIALFYVHALISMPWASKRPRYKFWRIVFAVIVETAVFELLSHCADLLLIAMGVASRKGVVLNIQYWMRDLYRNLYFIGFATGYYYIITYINERKRSADLETQRLQEIISRRIAEEEAVRSQNAFLVAQINPHFLFNTLDYLYHNLLSLDVKLADAVISLSGMMRFAIDADKLGGVIRLGDELEQVENLIYLHQVRQKLWINLQIDEAATAYAIIPLVLLTLTENVFKHGNLRNEDEAAEMSIYTDETYLHIHSENTINLIVNPARSLTGLANIRKRLEVAYPQKFTFVHGADDRNRFKVHIKIELAALTHAGAFSYHSAGIGIV